MQIEVIIEKKSHKLDAEEGKTILETLQEHGIHVLTAPCGGRGRCGKCTVEVEHMGEVLACMTKVTDGMRITIPKVQLRAQKSKIAENGTGQENGGAPLRAFRRRDFHPGAGLLDVSGGWTGGRGYNGSFRLRCGCGAPGARRARGGAVRGAEAGDGTRGHRPGNQRRDVFHLTAGRRARATAPARFSVFRAVQENFLERLADRARCL